MKLAKIDGEINQKIRNTFEYRGYPTIYFLKKGKIEEYDGGRRSDEIVEWIRKRTEVKS